MPALCLQKIPSLRCSCRKRPVSCREAEGLVMQVWSPSCYNTVIVLSVVLCDCCKPTSNFWDWAFSNSGLEVGLPAFQLPMFAQCAALQKRDLCDMFVSGIHAFCTVKAATPYCTRSLRSLRAAARHDLPALHYACKRSHPFVAAAEEKQPHAEKQSVWSCSCGLLELLQYCDCAPSCAMRLLQTNKHLSRRRF